MDDGSTDNSLEVLKQFEGRIEVIAQRNTGLPGARNAGIARSNGELIAFLDADDMWRPNKLETQVPLFTNSKVNFVHSAARFFTDDGSWSNVQFFGSEIGYHDILNYKVLSLQTALIRRSALDAVGTFDLNVKGADDWDMMLRISSRYPLTGIDDCLADIRCVQTSMSRAPKHLKWRMDYMFVSQLKVLDKNRGVHTNCAECSDALKRTRLIIRSYYYGSCKDAGIAAFKARKPLLGSMLIIAAHRYKPAAVIDAPVKFLKLLVMGRRNVGA